MAGSKQVSFRSFGWSMPGLLLLGHGHGVSIWFRVHGVAGLRGFRAKA